MCNFVRCSSRHNVITAFVPPFHQRMNAFLFLLHEIVYTHMVSNSHSQTVVVFQFRHTHFNTFYIHSSLRKIHGFPLLFAFASIHPPETPKSWKSLLSFPDIPFVSLRLVPHSDLLCLLVHRDYLSLFQKKGTDFSKSLILHFCF